MIQIIELPVSEKDIEKEHHAQLRRWKESHGDLLCKSPPRMHGAKAIIAADPPSRQDLRQRPTIIVESPLATVMDKKVAEDVAVSRKTNAETVQPSREPVDPYLCPSDQSPSFSQMSITGSKESLNSAEQDTYL